jgi:hypothetical protein
MKKYILSFAAILIIFSCGENKNQSKESTNGNSSIVATTAPQEGFVDESSKLPDVKKGETSIEFFEAVHNFGDVFYPSDNLYTFKFKNTGEVPLVIQSATASCGCTVPNKPEEPIMPGEIGELDVIFRPKEGQTGQLVTKKVTVVANTKPKETYLEVKANVKLPLLNNN